MLIDTHSHLNFSAFKNDFDGVIKRCLDNNIWVINVGTKYETSKKAVEIAQKYEKGVYAAVGLHPIHLEERKIDPFEVDFQRVFKTSAEQFDYEKFKELAKSKKVVAIGEIGLDYYYKPKTKRKLELFKEKQRTVLCQQISLAEELNLPVIFHCRMAHQDLLEVLKSEIRNPKSETNSKSQIPNPKLRGVIHCYTGNWEQAKEYLDMGFYLGFNGIIFKFTPHRTEGSGLGLNLDEVIKNTPLAQILIETDCPYLTPLPAVTSAEAGPQPIRNEPLYVKFVAEYIAKIKNLGLEEIAEITTQNAKKLFRLSN